MGDLVEIVQFRMARGVDEETFLKASDAAQFFFTKSRGFVNRELAKAPDGLHWIDIVRWRTMSDAEQAARNAIKDPQYANFLRLIEKSSIKTARMEHTRLYH